jgi:hypothetical protein
MYSRMSKRSFAPRAYMRSRSFASRMPTMSSRVLVHHRKARVAGLDDRRQMRAADRRVARTPSAPRGTMMSRTCRSATSSTLEHRARVVVDDAALARGRSMETRSSRSWGSPRDCPIFLSQRPVAFRSFDIDDPSVSRLIRVVESEATSTAIFAALHAPRVGRRVVVVSR